MNKDDPIFVCASCDQTIDFEEDEEMISVDGQPLHKDCFIEDMEEVEN